MEKPETLAADGAVNSLPVNTFRQMAQGMQPKQEPVLPETPDDSPLGRRARERSQRRREILDVARQHFSRLGYTGTTLDEIAKQAEFAKPTLYQFFSSKEHLFHTILQDGYQDLLGILRKAAGAEGSATHQFRTLCVMFLIYYRKHLDFFVMHRQVQERLKRSEENDWHQKSQQLYGEVRARVKGLLSKGMESGEFQRLDSERVCSTFLETLSVYTHAFQEGGEIRTATEMADEIMNLFLNGLSNRH